MATSGSVTSGKAKSSYFYINWQLDSQSIANNTSTINYQGGFVIGGGNLWYSNAIKIYSSGTTGGHSGTYSNVTSNGTYQKFSGSFTVYHNSDGTGSVSIGISGWFYDYGNKSGSNTFSLPTIARASTPSTTSSAVTIGNILQINTNRASSGFTHTLDYSTDNSTWYRFASDVGSSYSWTVPYDVANGFPSSTTGTLYIKCSTLNGSTSIGTKTISVAVTIPEDTVTKPAIGDIPIIDGSTIKPPEFSNEYVQSLSRLVVTPTATGKYNATIKKCETIILGTVYTHSVSDGIDSITSSIVKTSGDVVVSVKVTDSRGFTRTLTKTVTVVPYILPSISTLTAVQEDGKITVNISGIASAVKDLNAVSLNLQYKLASASTFETTTVTLSNPYNFAESKEITISGLIASVPYVIVAVLNDTYTEDISSPITKSITTNLSIDLAKASQGYIAIPVNGKLYNLDYYGVSNSAWDAGTYVNVSSALNGMLYDKTLGIMVGYTTDKQITYSAVNYKETWNTDYKVSEFITDICTAGNKVYCLGKTKIWNISLSGEDYILEENNLPALSADDEWKFIVGNDYRMYIVSQGGIIYHTNIDHINWVQTRFVDSDGVGIVPTSLAPILSGQFYATPNSLVALINTSKGWGVYVTPTTSYR